jgi:TusA-related sulfurtransferase
MMQDDVEIMLPDNNIGIILPDGKEVIFSDIASKMNIMSSNIYREEYSVAFDIDNVKLIQSRFYKRRDGIHFCCSFLHHDDVIELLFKYTSTEKDIPQFVKQMTAAVAAVMIYQTTKIEFGKETRKWVRNI